MSIQRLKQLLPVGLKIKVRQWLKLDPSKARRESNRWLREHTADTTGAVLSIGSGPDYDKEGGYYRDYFKNCSSYTTSEVSADFGCDLVLDVRSMPQVRDGSYDCIFCSGVLEHVDDYRSGLSEITRVLKPGGILLLGLPFRQAIHLPPHDYWRFTEYGLRYLLEKDYEILELAAIDNRVRHFPASYWIKARKR
jgi:SAM-dependent methyltransferase